VQLQCLQCAPGRRVTVKKHFFTQIVGLAGTRDQTWDTLVAGSGTNRSAIHYDLLRMSIVDVKVGELKAADPVHGSGFEKILQSLSIDYTKLHNQLIHRQ
jgi:hypothetical protein